MVTEICWSIKPQPAAETLPILPSQDPLSTSATLLLSTPPRLYSLPLPPPSSVAERRASPVSPPEASSPLPCPLSSLLFLSSRRGTPPILAPIFPCTLFSSVSTAGPSFSSRRRSHRPRPFSSVPFSTSQGPSHRRLSSFPLQNPHPPLSSLPPPWRTALSSFFPPLGSRRRLLLPQLRPPRSIVAAYLFLSCGHRVPSPPPSSSAAATEYHRRLPLPPLRPPSTIAASLPLRRRSRSIHSVKTPSPVSLLSRSAGR